MTARRRRGILSHHSDRERHHEAQHRSPSAACPEVLDHNRSFSPGGLGNELRLYGISNPYLGLRLQVVEVSGPGVYQLTGQSFGSTAEVSLHPPKDGWHPTVGSVTVIEIGPSGARGTFSFTAEPGYWSKEAGQLVVTNGRFDVTF